MAATQSISHLKIVSFNVHGYNQGKAAIDETISSLQPDILLLQEHWLTPANLYKLDSFDQFFSFGRSAMESQVESGMLRGRPFGGIAILINNRLRSVTQTIYCSERFALIKIDKLIIVSLYLPCAGTSNRMYICEDVLSDLESWLEEFLDCDFIVAGDFNVNLCETGVISKLINDFRDKYSLTRCDSWLSTPRPTYVNEALNQQNTIDYILTSNPQNLIHFQVLDPNVNFSDHLPIMCTVKVAVDCSTNKRSSACKDNFTVAQLRWDHADLISYYYYTGLLLQPLEKRIDDFIVQLEKDVAADSSLIVNSIHDDVVNVLKSVADSCVPRHKKNFYKFWWDVELDTLKQASIESDQLWKAVGKPRTGPIFEKRRACRLQYRKRIRDSEAAALTSYTNDLHEALLKKDQSTFWKSWKSKFENLNKCEQVEGCTDPSVIAENFAQHFSKLYCCTDTDRAGTIFSDYLSLRQTYSGSPFSDEYVFDVELVSKVIAGLKRGKAAGLDGLSVEHFLYSHPVLPCLLMKLFKLIVLCRQVPASFGYSYTVPIPKIRDCRTKAMTCDDFRGIAISSTMSKIFEHCILERFSRFFQTSDNQFGFKKGLSCAHAIYSVRNIVERFNAGGSTANICAIDLSKAFDRVNHHALLIKLMKRHVPLVLLEILEFWFSNCWSCVKWGDILSPLFKIEFGVRQGSVLSPFLFALYVNDIFPFPAICSNVFVILYADDILLLTSSVTELQNLLTTCERELRCLDMHINVKKSGCLRVGPRCNASCMNIMTLDGYVIPWVKEIKYLGVYIVQSRAFKCSWAQARKAFYRSLNSIFGKVGRSASEEVVLQLVYSKCVPVLLYGSEACPLTKSDLNSMDFAFIRFTMKLFKTGNIDLYNEICIHFGIDSIENLIADRQNRFIGRYRVTDNCVCQMLC